MNSKCLGCFVGLSLTLLSKKVQHLILDFITTGEKKMTQYEKCHPCFCVSAVNKQNKKTQRNKTERLPEQKLPSPCVTGLLNTLEKSSFKSQSDVCSWLVSTHCSVQVTKRILPAGQEFCTSINLSRWSRFAQRSETPDNTGRTLCCKLSEERRRHEGRKLTT